MGTRGLVGFRLDEKDYLAYQQFDSYPTGVGDTTLVELKELLFGDTRIPLKDQVRAIRLVNESDEPTEEEQKQYTETWDNVSTGGDWYSFLRDCQGHIAKWLKVGVMYDSKSFINNSLFCEWAYIVNLDTMKLEVYKGFQTKPTKRSRYKARKSRTWKPKYQGDNFYYPCELIAEFPFAELPEKLSDALDPILREMYPEEYTD